MEKICIRCPQGCRMDIQVAKDGKISVSGNKCRRGEEYAVEEMTNPVRTITTTVKTSFDDYPRLPVKTESDVPLKEIFKYMEEINSIVVSKRLQPGDVVAENLYGSGVRLIATADMK